MAQIGVDMGGSKADLAIDENGTVRFWSGAGVNIRVAGPRRAAEVLHQSLKTVQGQDVRLCIGAAGAGNAAVASSFRDAISNLTGWPKQHIQVITDAEIALQGAFHGESGVVVIAGTGSGCYAFDESGRFHRAGGLGVGTGDPASGHTIGQRGLESGLIQLDTNEARPRPSDLAPRVLDLASEGDEIARGIIVSECRALATQCAHLFEDERRTSAPLGQIRKRIVLVGGLTTEPVFRTALIAAISARIPDCMIVEALASPAEGALQWARAMP